ncbi:type II toxin-antitoxin system RelE/ParE family toxin [Flavimarina sp. Hel_I_48]|uniref:type II toxin-antitoxin system RelE/ParE family toxin n=1 Tax=Flavimarina sp. Hel_I_48 TaxID=1392488 RepID=UPI0004DF3F10|nr:type II toxin-antitoxin system RelE/ParE family toxin [Flavimarina sp. Hel_I_48]
MSSYNLSSKADNDIDDIVDYTLETWGESQTHDYVSELFQLLQTLAESPEIGRSASEYAPSLKRYNFKSHTVFYEPTKNGIFVVRILGQRQDFKRHL